MVDSIRCVKGEPLGNTNLDKLKKVILSCETKEQFKVAIRYYNLSLKSHKISYNDRLDLSMCIGYVLGEIDYKQLIN